ncbi:MAG: PQQ-binding-like beta-propeller repeat protein [Bacteroidia bacterium]
MKKQILVLTAVLFATASFAQEEMSTVWEAKCEHKFDSQGVSDSKGFLYGASDKEMTVCKNKDGNVMWTKRFKDIAPGLSKVDEQIPMWDANVMFLFDRKTGKDKIACIELTSGALLWATEKYQDISDENVVYIPEMEAFAISTKAALTMIKARTGEEIWTTAKFKGVVGAYAVGSDNYMVMLNYKPSGIAALFAGFKNQIIKINMKNGDVAWDQTYVGIAEKKVITRESTAKIKLEGSKVFLYLNGIQVYDYNTGAQQWSAAFDADINVVSKPAGAKRFGCYGVVAEPLIVDNDVYVIDMKDKKHQFIKKYDLNSGKLLWTSPEISDAKALPGLYLSGNTLVLQIGGVIECQAYIYERTRQADGTYLITERWTVYYRNVKPNGLQAFDNRTGAKIWESERFKKGITNCFVNDNTLFVCSGKALYSIDITAGKENYEIVLAGDDINDAQKIIDYKDRILIVGEKGIANHAKADGKLMASGRWKSGEFAGMYNKTLLFQRDNDDIAAYDVETCKFRAYNARKESVSKLSDDGMYVYIWEKKTISKLATQ